MNRLTIKDRLFCVPELFNDLINESGSFALYTGRDILNFNRISKDIKSGRFIIIPDSDIIDVENAYRSIVKRIDELITFEDSSRIKEERSSSERKRKAERLRNNIFSRLLLIVCNNRIISFNGEMTFRHLLSFCGEDPLSVSEDTQYLLPFDFYKKLTASLNESVFIDALGMNITSGINVLLPKSQETTELFKAAFQDISLKSVRNVIDMGCGSGVLTLLADSYFTGTEIFFSDILPEALASTIRNIENNIKCDFRLKEGRFFCRTDRNLITCIRSGDLFENTDDLFDIIIFNPPWIDTVSRNRSELALNDKDQKTAERFLIQAKRRLSEGGNIIMAYSDNSGDNAVEKFNKLITDNGFIIKCEHSCRIQSHQAGRKWMKVFVRILEKNNVVQN